MSDACLTRYGRFNRVIELETSQQVSFEKLRDVVVYIMLAQNKSGK